MWVFCCGMFRSAFTLQFQITTRLVKDAEIGQQVSWIDANRFWEVRESYANCDRLKVVKVHLCTDTMLLEFEQNSALGLYVFRDLRDVYASYMKQRQKSFDYLWNEGFIETCLDSYKRWTRLPRVLVSRYEEIMGDLPREVKRIAEYLNIHLALSQCQQIAADYSLENQQNRIKKFREELLQTPRNCNDHREIVDYYDENSLLHINHIDSAKVGRWQEDLSAKEVSLIENKVNQWCKRNEYKPATFLRQIYLKS